MKKSQSALVFRKLYNYYKQTKQIFQLGDYRVTISPDFSECSPEIPRLDTKKMLTITRNGGQTVVEINSSSLGIIQSCGRKSYYTLKRGMQGRNGSPPLVFGHAIHKALEVFYSHPSRVRTIPVRFNEKSDLLVHQDLRTVIDTVGASNHFLFDAIAAFLKDAEPLRMLPDTDKRSLASGVYILQNYFKTYINDPYVVYSDANGPVSERTFSTPLYEDPLLKVILFGTIDVVLKSEVTGEILPADHKTSSVLGSDFFNRLKPNHQYTGYLLGAQKVLGLSTESFMVNALQVKARPLTARGSAPMFTRQITTRSPHDMVEFTQAVLFAVRSYLLWEETQAWPLGPVGECASFGGCQYLKVCSAPSELRENLLEDAFNATSQAE